MFSVLSKIIGILVQSESAGWVQLQSPAVGDGGSSELDYGRPTKGPRAAQSGSENHFLVASTVIA